MKRYKTILILCGVLAIACIATLVAMRYEEKQEQIKNSNETIIAIDADTVVGLSWDIPAGEDTDAISLSFTRTDSNSAWTWGKDADFPVDAEKMAELLETFADFGAAFEIDEVEDYSQYGLDDPTGTITLTLEDGTQTVVTLGTYSTMDEERYFSIDDGKVYLAAVDPLDTFTIGLSDVIDNDETPSTGQLSKLALSGAAELSVLYMEENTADTYCADDVYFAEVEGKNLPLSSSRVDSYYKTLRNLDLTDYVTYHATDEEIALYGLDDPELTISLTYTPSSADDEEASEETWVLTVSREALVKEEEEAAATDATGETEVAASVEDTEESVAETADTAEDTEESVAETQVGSTDAGDAEDAEEEDFDAYVRVGDSHIIYRIDSDTYEALLAGSYNDLRHTEGFTADFDAVTGIDILLEDTAYEITTQASEEAADTLVFLYDGEEVNLSDFESALTAIESEDFTDASADKKQEIAFTFYLDNAEHQTVSLQFYRYDGETCLMVLDGESVSLVDRSLVVDLIESVNSIVLK